MLPSDLTPSPSWVRESREPTPTGMEAKVESLGSCSTVVGAGAVYAGVGKWRALGGLACSSKKFSVRPGGCESAFALRSFSGGVVSLGAGWKPIFSSNYAHSGGLSSGQLRSQFESALHVKQMQARVRLTR